MRSFRYPHSALLLSISAFLTVSTTQAQWKTATTLQSGATDAANAFGIGDKVYFGGGSFAARAFGEFNPATHQWTRKADMPTEHMQRSFGVSFVLGNKGYVAFGQSDTSSDFSIQQGSVTNDLWEYDPTNDKWTQKANLPGPARDGAFAFTINNKAYIGAGVDTAFMYLGDFYEYDPVADKWTQKSDVPTGPIGFPMAFTVGNLGYIVGGGQPNEVSDAWSYDPSKDEWNPISPFPGTPRQAGAGFSIDTLGYAGLGEAQYTTAFSDMFSYNPKSDKWSSATAVPYKNGLGWPTVATLGQTVFIGGGADKNFSFSNVLYSYSFAQAGVDEAVAPIAATYPNPTTDYVRIALPARHEKVMVSIINEAGITIRKEETVDDQLSLSGLGSGIYNLQITSGEYHTTQRIVKQ